MSPAPKNGWSVLCGGQGGSKCPIGGLMCPSRDRVSKGTTKRWDARCRRGRGSVGLRHDSTSVIIAYTGPTNINTNMGTIVVRCRGGLHSSGLGSKLKDCAAAAACQASLCVHVWEEEDETGCSASHMRAQKLWMRFALRDVLTCVVAFMCDAIQLAHMHSTTNAATTCLLRPRQCLVQTYQPLRQRCSGDDLFNNAGAACVAPGRHLPALALRPRAADGV